MASMETDTARLNVETKKAEAKWAKWCSMGCIRAGIDWFGKAAARSSRRPAALRRLRTLLRTRAGAGRWVSTYAARRSRLTLGLRLAAISVTSLRPTPASERQYLMASVGR